MLTVFIAHLHVWEVMLHNYMITGPDGWTSGSCTGNRNSPIDIKAADTEKEVPVQWTKAGWDSSHQWDVKNSGYSGTLTALSIAPIYNKIMHS